MAGLQKHNYSFAKLLQRKLKKTNSPTYFFNISGEKHLSSMATGRLTNKNNTHRTYFLLTFSTIKHKY
jgi:hypothetical protein